MAMRGTTFAVVALLCSGCLEPRSCLELYTCVPDDGSHDETSDSGKHTNADGSVTSETLDSGTSETSALSTEVDGSSTSFEETAADGGSKANGNADASVCGDGAFGPGEVCDDGNTEDEAECGYGQAKCVACNATCSAVLDLTGPTCGDGVVTDEETCDEDASWCQDCMVSPIVEAGSAHTCMVLPTGKVRCWGRGTYGQLGSGVASSQNVPVQVSGLPDLAKSVAAGSGHSCALLVDGSVHCWGDGVYGQIGNGEKTKQPEPVQVSGLESGVRAIAAAGDHTCALKENGQVVCWGFGASGQLGNGETEDQAAPVSVDGLANVTALTAGSVHMCALLTTGRAKCWGFGTSGQLGNGEKASSSTPVDVADVEDITQLVAGAAHTCALLDTGAVTCWGAGTAGQLGNGETEDQLAPGAEANV